MADYVESLEGVDASPLYVLWKVGKLYLFMSVISTKVTCESIFCALGAARQTMEEEIYTAYQAELCWVCGDGAGGKDMKCLF